MSVNVVIATYSGRYRKFNQQPHSEYKEYYLRYILSSLDKIANNVTQITIVRPKVNPEHEEIPNYYNYDNIGLSERTRSKIKMYDCENRGISFGQFMVAAKHDVNKFDYFILFEDDYVPCKDFFEKLLIDKYTPNTYSCMFTFNQSYPSNYFNHLGIDPKMKQLTSTVDSFIVPDATPGILSNECINKIFKAFNDAEYSVEEFFSNKMPDLHFYQIQFGLMLEIAGVKIVDTVQHFIPVYYYSGTDKIKIFEHTAQYPVFIPFEFLLLSSNRTETLVKELEYIKETIKTVSKVK